jgi:hypothetical protein
MYKNNNTVWASSPDLTLVQLHLLCSAVEVMRACQACISREAAHCVLGVLSAHIDDGSSAHSRRLTALQVCDGVLSHFAEIDQEALPLLAARAFPSVSRRLDDASEDVRLAALQVLTDMLPYSRPDEDAQSLDACLAHITAGSPTDIFLNNLDTLLRIMAAKNPDYFSKALSAAENEAQDELLEPTSRAKEIFNGLRDHVSILAVLKSK